MATTSTMGQPTRASTTANKVWWAIAIVAAVLIVMALIGRRNANAPVTEQSTMQGTLGESTSLNNQNANPPGTPTRTDSGSAPGAPANTVPNR